MEALDEMDERTGHAIIEIGMSFHEVKRRTNSLDIGPLVNPFLYDVL